MTLFRTIVVLVGGLVLLLAVVILRAETARLNYETARVEREVVELREELRNAELRLARLRSPFFLRQRAEEALQTLGGEAAKSGESTSEQAGSEGEGR